MLLIEVPKNEIWDEGTKTFIYVEKQTLKLEHSLVSIHKWESKYHKPFMTKNEKTKEEEIDYIRFMTLDKNIDPYVYFALTNDNKKEINKYIEDPMTATTFSKRESDKSKIDGEQVTAELIYYWMFTLGIPYECRKWHLNQLITLIKVCSIKSQPPKKMGRNEIFNRNRSLNAARRARLNSKG